MASIIADRSLLLNAYRRILTTRNRPYRQLQRLEIEALATSYTQVIDEIYARLLTETYTPSTVDNIELPKNELSDRTYKLLSMSDWIVYTAIATIVAETSHKVERHRYNSSIYSNRPRIARKDRPRAFFHHWERQYKRFNDACERASKTLPFVLDFDLASFYDLIDHDLLVARVRAYVSDVYLLDLLSRMLRSWTRDSSNNSFGHGIPQGTDPSAFLSDLYLFTVDDEFINGKDFVYLRYADDIRIFASNKRDCEVLALKLENAVKRVGLVPNPSKTEIFDTQTRQGWLRQLDYGLVIDDWRKRKRSRRNPTVLLQHLRSKREFLQYFRNNHSTPENEMRLRRALTRMLPDREVLQRIVRVYPKRPDTWDLLFEYLLDYGNNSIVSRFCWRRLELPAVRDWETARLIELAVHSTPNIDGKQHKLLEQYAANSNLPLSQARAISTLLDMGKRPTAKWLGNLPQNSVCVGTWLPIVLRKYLGGTAEKRSVIAIVRRLIASPSDKLSFLVAYLAGARLSKADLRRLPVPQSAYSQSVLNNVAQLGHQNSVDEIGPLLRYLFGVRIPKGYDFRVKLNNFDNKLYGQALRQLQLASWYFDTSPTHAVNYIHNFNHVLWYYTLHKHKLVQPTMPWKNIWGQVTNKTVISQFPTMTKAFENCRVARNTNVSSHPMDDRRKRLTKLVTYKERDRLRAQLRAAYSEFIQKA